MSQDYNPLVDALYHCSVDNVGNPQHAKIGKVMLMGLVYGMQNWPVFFGVGGMADEDKILEVLAGVAQSHRIKIHPDTVLDHWKWHFTKVMADIVNQEMAMTKDVFKELRPGDKVHYNRQWVTVDKWLEPEYMVQYTNGTNTKITDPWLAKMLVSKQLASMQESDVDLLDRVLEKHGSKLAVEPASPQASHEFMQEPDINPDTDLSCPNCGSNETQYLAANFHPNTVSHNCGTMFDKGAASLLNNQAPEPKYQGPEMPEVDPSWSALLRSGFRSREENDDDAG